jgi:hypothetical protein
MLFDGHGGLLQGMSIPSPWLRMIHLSGQIYKKLTPGQKIKLVDMGVLPPNFEKELLFVFNTYIPQEQQKLSLQTATEKKKKEDSPYEQFHETLKMIKPDELKIYTKPYSGFLNLIKSLMRERHPNVKVSNSRDTFPNYPFFYAEWKKIQKF